MRGRRRRCRGTAKPFANISLRLAKGGPLHEPSRAAAVPWPRLVQRAGLARHPVRGRHRLASQIAHAGGPPFQMLVMPRRLEREVLIGTTAIFFAALNWIKVPAYVALGQFKLDNLLTTLILLPSALLGSLAGVKSLWPRGATGCRSRSLRSRNMIILWTWSRSLTSKGECRRRNPFAACCAGSSIARSTWRSRSCFAAGC